MALHSRPDGDDEIRLIIAKAAMSVPLPSFHPDKESPTTKGEQMKLMVNNLRVRHDQIRKNILGQCPKTIPQSPLEDTRMKKFYAQRKAENFAKVGQSILDLLNEPISRPESRPKFALLPTQPGQPYDKPLPTTQDYEMQPFLHELLPIMRALDTFNIYAAQHLRRVEEEKEKLERDGMSKIPLVVARKRSASDAKLDESPPMKPSVSNAKLEERPPMKRSVSWATPEEVMSAKRRGSGIKLEHSSPRQTVEMVDRSKSPNPTLIRDLRLSSRDPRLNRDSGMNGGSGYSPTNGDSRSIRDPGLNGGSGYSPTNGDPRLCRLPSFALPTSPTRDSRSNQDPRLNSRDPRLNRRDPRLKDR